MRIRLVTILRGAHGSGKTTWSNKNLRGTRISTDNFFVGTDGKYKHDRGFIEKAYQGCLATFLDYVIYNKIDHIIVDNTHIKLEEIAPYYQIAKTFGLQVQIYWIVAPLDLCYQRNFHNVGFDIIREQVLSPDPLPRLWDMKIITMPEAEQTLNIPKDKTYPEDSVQCNSCGGWGCKDCMDKGWLIPKTHKKGRTCYKQGCGNPLHPTSVAVYCANLCAHNDS